MGTIASGVAPRDERNDDRRGDLFAAIATIISDGCSRMAELLVGPTAFKSPQFVRMQSTLQ